MLSAVLSPPDIVSQCRHPHSQPQKNNIIVWGSQGVPSNRKSADINSLAQLQRLRTLPFLFIYFLTPVRLIYTLCCLCLFTSCRRNEPSYPHFLRSEGWGSRGEVFTGNFPFTIAVVCLMSQDLKKKKRQTEHFKLPFTHFWLLPPEYFLACKSQVFFLMCYFSLLFLVRGRVWINFHPFCHRFTPLCDCNLHKVKWNKNKKKMSRVCS